jgi:hypothetical protein
VGDELLAALSGPFTDAYLVASFARAAGVRHLAVAIQTFRAGGGVVRALIGVDGKITTGPGARALLRLSDELWTLRHPGTLFHPKTFVFEGRRSGRILIGSANLTESALWTNYEDVAVIDLDLRDQTDRAVLDDFKRAFTDRVSTPNAELADAALLTQLEGAGLLPSEVRSRQESQDQQRRQNAKARQQVPGKFPATALPPPPQAPLLPEEQADRAANPPPPRRGRAPRRGSGALPGSPPPTTVTRNRTFVLKLGTRDVGTRSGFSPDVYIPLAAYRNDPSYWGVFAPSQTTGDPERRASVEFRRRNGTLERDRRRLWFYGARAEFRFNSGQIHADAAVGDLMVLEIAPPGTGVEYIAEVVKPGDSRFAYYDSIASNQVSNSPKRWGYV